MPSAALWPQPEPGEIAVVLVVQEIVETTHVEIVVEDRDGFQNLEVSGCRERP